MGTTEVAKSHHPANARVNLDAIRQNYRALRQHAGTCAVIPVIKANAYGHGAIAVAKALEPLGVSLIAVAYVSEAIALREGGIKTPILVLTGFAPDQLGQVMAFDLTPVISTPEQLEALEGLRLAEAEGEAEGKAALRVHVKVDTLMSRLGFTLKEIEPAVHRLEDVEGVHIDGLMTHLASADEDEIATARQLDLFDEAIVRLETLGVRPRLIHAANSAGLAFVRNTHTAVRPGLLLYGLSPRPLSPKVAVTPAMELRARVALLKTVAPGTPVSYGGRFVATGETRIATINAGYADGIPRTRRMSEQGFLHHGETPLKVAGTVCMDLTMLDASSASALRVGDEITVFGESPTAWDLAEWAGTNAWQVLTSVGPRVPREYVLGGARVSAQTLEPL